MGKHWAWRKVEKTTRFIHGFHRFYSLRKAPKTQRKMVNWETQSSRKGAKPQRNFSPQSHKNTQNRYIPIEKQGQDVDLRCPSIQ